ncbi:hypothetical protein BX286_5034 [Streptomyces sp. 3211.6]|uniref:hypothetical protein n=1 Tax=Streptomyces sp. 3211.6 TaxID=1938845 RepID=UPI000EAEC930|nr:hypothetical protein [Streptomyces sp. 3211.6]RKT06986.1 hypothetical protein BX286_5034 [Streptomyces sp. 3211.6]
MRLRPTATAAATLLASAALVLPTAGQALANGHDDLGEIHYRLPDDDGSRTIEPADNDTCYRLTGTGRDRAAYAVWNETDSLVLVFRDESCGGEAQEVLRPGERAHDLNARSVYLKPTDDDHHHGRHDRDDDWGDEDRARPRQERGKDRVVFDKAFLEAAFRSIG